MNELPEALLLANILEHPIPSIACLEVSAAKLRRLYEVNTYLVSLLKRYRSEIPLGHQPHMIAAEVDEAIAKAEGKSK